MRFSFAAVAVAFAAAFTSAAVIPRAYLEQPSGLEARSLPVEAVYARAADTAPIVEHLVRRDEPQVLVRRGRLHARDFHDADRVIVARRSVEPEQLQPRRLHARDFSYGSQPVVVVAREEPPSVVYRREDAPVVVIARSEEQLYRRRLHPRDFRRD